jgi:uncharacterized membrane protein
MALTEGVRQMISYLVTLAIGIAIGYWLKGSGYMNKMDSLDKK